MSECPRRSLSKPNIEHKKLDTELYRKNVEAARCWAWPMLAHTVAARGCLSSKKFDYTRARGSKKKRPLKPPSIEAKGG